MAAVDVVMPAAPMAAVDVAMPAPPPPPAPAVVRISRLAQAVADTVLCLWIASLWVLFASVAAALIRLLACGWGCTAAAWMAVLVSLLFLVLFWNLTSVLMDEFEDTFFHYMNQLKKAMEPISEAVVNAHLIVITAFACLEFVGILLKLLPAKDPPTARFAFVVMVMPPLGICVMCCLVSIPVCAVRVWSMRRHGRAAVVPV